MNRRTPGSGSIEWLPSGKCRYAFKVDGERVRGTAVATKEEALQDMAAAMARVDSGAVSPATSFGAWGAAWLERRSTVNADTERGMWRLHVLPCELAELPLQEVRPRALLAWAEGLQRHRRLVQVAGGGRQESDETISLQTQRLAWALVRRVLGAAVAEEAIPLNPARGLRPEWPEEAIEEAWGFLEEPEIVQLLSCDAVPLAARLHYGWAAGAGARPRESWALRWGQLDLQALTARITRSGARATTKTKRPRPFPLLPLAAESLAEWREIAPDTRPDALVWPARLLPPAPGGARWRCGGKTPGTMRAGGEKGDDFGWADRRRGVDKEGRPRITLGHRSLAGLREGLTYYCLRHTCAAGLLRGYEVLGVARRWSLDEVCDFLGHSNRRTTERYAEIAGGGLAARAAAEGREAHARPTSSAASATPPVGDRGAVRTRDLLFRNKSCSQRSPGVTGAVGLPWASWADLGRSVQILTAAGAPVPLELLQALGEAGAAAAWAAAGGAAGDLRRLASAGALARLVLQLQEGGEHALMRALELAALLQGEAALQRYVGPSQRGRRKKKQEGGQEAEGG